MLTCKINNDIQSIITVHDDFTALHGIKFSTIHTILTILLRKTAAFIA